MTYNDIRYANGSPLGVINRVAGNLNIVLFVTNTLFLLRNQAACDLHNKYPSCLVRSREYSMGEAVFNATSDPDLAFGVVTLMAEISQKDKQFKETTLDYDALRTGLINMVDTLKNVRLNLATGCDTPTYGVTIHLVRPCEYIDDAPWEKFRELINTHLLPHGIEVIAYSTGEDNHVR